MTDRPILFSAPMVRALLDGRKTQTRRVMNPQPQGISSAEHFSKSSWSITPESNRCTVDFKAPSYATGDRLWVRETFAQSGACWPRIRQGLGRLHYRADPDHGWHDYWGRWRPSIHMPRWASRLTLTVTDVRVQRLQDLSEFDAIAEGCRPYFDHDNPSEHAGPNGTVHQMAPLRGPLDDFHRLWDNLNADRAPWASNPWVCAVSFAVHKCNIDRVGEAA